MTSGNLKFILCEDVRPETNGKLTLTGVYPGEIIVLNKLSPETKIPEGLISILPRLVMVTFFHDATGGAKAVRATVTSPSGKVILRAQVGEFTVEEGKAGTLIIQTGPIGIPELGSYRLDLSLDDSTHSFNFDIRPAADFVLPKSKGEPSKGTRARGQEKSAIEVAKKKRGASRRYQGTNE